MSLAPCLRPLPFLVAITALGAAAETPPPAPAAPDPLDRLGAAIAAEPGISPELKSAFDDALVELRGMKVSLDRTAAVTSPLDRLRLYGDFRLRHETDFSIEDAKDRNRERVRLRFGATYQIVPSLSVGARLTTGSREDPRSPHQTLGDEFDKFEINLDRAFLTFAPGDAVPGFSISAGKIAHPLVSYSVYPELVWDADVQPTGLASVLELTKLVRSPEWLTSARLVAGGYVVSEYQASDDAYSPVFQGAIEVRPAEGWTAQAGAAYYYYSDLTPDGETVAVSENTGNVLVDTDGDGVDDDFASGFSIVEPSASVTCGLLPVPITVSGEYIHNFRADDASLADGYAVGASVGRAQKAGDLRVYYQWQQVERDAVLSLFSQDDFRRTVNFRGHVFGASYLVADAVGLHTWFLVSRVDDPSPSQTDDYEWRFRFDINVRF